MDDRAESTRDVPDQSSGNEEQRLDNRAAGDFIRALLCGSPPNGTDLQAFGPFQDLIANLVMAHTNGGPPAVRQAWQHAVWRHPQLSGLVAGDIAAQAQLDEVIATFNRWLFFPDPGLIQVVLGTVAANRMSGDPVWLMLVGGSSHGKTEILLSLSGLSHVHIRSCITESGLLSGTPTKQKLTGAKGGLLPEIGAFGYLVLKDFTSILSMHRDARAAILAGLREIYDGRWTRNLGWMVEER